MMCRHCGAELTLPLIDLGSAPPSNAYLTDETLHAPERWYPLRVLVCTICWLAQTEDYAGADELFSADYAYFSSYSTTWVQHAKRYVAEMTDRFDINRSSFVIEVAANDGYLLQFVKERGIPCLGIEPTGSTAAAARARGIEIVENFFDTHLARKLAATGRQADLLVANNVLGHVPDINDFVAGFAILLKPSGIATFEFPHLLSLVMKNEFDTIYHEHFSYLSLIALTRIFERNGLGVFDVVELNTHGGSLRIFAQRLDVGGRKPSSDVAELMAREQAAGVASPSFYAGFQDKADGVKNDLVAFLIQAKDGGKTVAGYGAAAKGNTLLNYSGLRPDLLAWVADRNPAKQGKYLPGSRIPIVSDSRIMAERPEYIVVLPWNLLDEVIVQLAYVREWGGHLVTAVPSLRVYEVGG